MKCYQCGKAFKDNDEVFPVLKAIEGKHGVFVNAVSPIAYVHLHHLKT